MRRAAVISSVAAVVAAAAGVAYAASFTLTTSHLGASAVTTPIMFPVSVATTNVGTAGKAEKNDTVTFVFSRPINQSTVCAGWTTQKASQTVNVTWTIQDGTGANGDDVLVAGAAAAPCTAGVHVGTVDLGASGYVSGGSVNFPNSPTKLTLSANNVVITLTGAQAGGGTVGTVNSGSAAVWTPDPAVGDTTGNTIGASGANLAKSSANNQF